jgi:hypothetical protein
VSLLQSRPVQPAQEPDRQQHHGIGLRCQYSLQVQRRGGDILLVVDRRQTSSSRPNCDLLVGCDASSVTDCILRSFAAAAAAT